MPRRLRSIVLLLATSCFAFDGIPNELYYQNPEDGIIFGPFSSAQLIQWLADGYFNYDLLVSGQAVGPFHPLHSYSGSYNWEGFAGSNHHPYPEYESIHDSTGQNVYYEYDYVHTPYGEYNEENIYQEEQGRDHGDIPNHDYGCIFYISSSNLLS